MKDQDYVYLCAFVDDLDLCFLHGFNHVHFDLGYFSNKIGYHPHELLIGFYSVTVFADIATTVVGC
jgi:hypothetical protein